MNISGRPLDNQLWQTECKTGPLVKVQLCKYENQTLEASVAARCLCAKFDCPVVPEVFFRCEENIKRQAKKRREKTSGYPQCESHYHAIML